jgi:hypothetical protein
MAIIKRTAGPWGSGKGSNLTPAEVDGNFWDLEERVIELETNPPAANSIANISATGSQVTVTLDDATTFTFTMPTARWIWTGDWVDATVYAINDFFADPDTGSIYVVIKGHTSAAPCDPVYELVIDGTAIAAAAGGGLGGFSSYVSHSSSTLTLDEADANVFYILESASNDIAITLPADSTSFDLPIGTTIGFVKNHDLNVVTITADNGFFGASDANETIRRVGSVFYVRKVGVDEWILYGDLDKHANAIRNDTATGTVNVTWSTYARKTWVVHNAGSGVTFDLRTDAQEPKWQIGSEIGFIQAGAGQMTFTCSGGTLVKKSATTPISVTAGSWVRLIKTAANTWTIIGDYS